MSMSVRKAQKCIRCNAISKLLFSIEISKIFLPYFITITFVSHRGIAIKGFLQYKFSEQL